MSNPIWQYEVLVIENTPTDIATWTEVFLVAEDAEAYIRDCEASYKKCDAAGKTLAHTILMIAHLNSEPVQKKTILEVAK